MRLSVRVFEGTGARRQLSQLDALKEAQKHLTPLPRRRPPLVGTLKENPGFSNSILIVL
jgi:hypothetical protein